MYKESLKVLFFVGLFIFLGGAYAFRNEWHYHAHIVTNVIGLATILLGVYLSAEWAQKKYRALRNIK